MIKETKADKVNIRSALQHVLFRHGIIHSPFVDKAKPIYWINRWKSIATPKLNGYTWMYASSPLMTEEEWFDKVNQGSYVAWSPIYTNIMWELIKLAGKSGQFDEIEYDLISNPAKYLKWTRPGRIIEEEAY